jgi:uncharacterized protein YecE (DUF72 family)
MSEGLTPKRMKFRNGIDPLRDAGRLGALLLQFPWSFKNTQENREHLASLIERFRILLALHTRSALSVVRGVGEHD